MKTTLHYLFGGTATFTGCTRQGRTYTLQVRKRIFPDKPDHPRYWLFKFWNDRWNYLVEIPHDLHELRQTKNSPRLEFCAEGKICEYFDLFHIVDTVAGATHHSDVVSVQHDGHCSGCRQALVGQESQDRGLCPECVKNAQHCLDCGTFMKVPLVLGRYCPRCYREHDPEVLRERELAYAKYEAAYQAKQEAARIAREAAGR